MVGIAQHYPTGFERDENQLSSFGGASVICCSCDTTDSALSSGTPSVGQQFSLHNSSSVNRRCTDSYGSLTREQLLSQFTSHGTIKRHDWHSLFVKSTGRITSKGVVEHYFQLLKQAQCDCGLEVM